VGILALVNNGKIYVCSRKVDFGINERLGRQLLLLKIFEGFGLAF